MTREKKFDSVAKSSAIAVLEDELKIRSNVYAEYIAHGGKADCGEEFYLDALDMAIAALREQGNCCKKGNSSWISVEDRLPEGREDVLVVTFWRECCQPVIGWYSDMTGKWRIVTPFGENETAGVTHWMPLPEPPEVEV